ncbi:MAG: tRNA (guanosine(37)-N1)-methyltransferase TrmD [Abitibacteriaceae bacterium]|nr:tRNA (guanosine(37)-N1)-methyltransferase TrmD [Abditibacteriaceae bacterium]
MRFDIFTLFPSYFEGPFHSSILKRAQSNGAIEIAVHDIRAWTTDRHHVCDDAPYGGGAGMVMKAEPVAKAIEDVLNLKVGPGEAACPVILMSPQGRRFSQAVAQELSQLPRVALLCGHYEGLDERAVELFVTDEISIGDYVLTGGEPAAAVIVDAVARLVPGVLGNEESAVGDSFADGLLEAPHYTRPVEWRGLRVPDVLLSGHHGEVAKWRWKEGLQRTLQRRPDLVEAALKQRQWTVTELRILEELKSELHLTVQPEFNTASNED